MVNLPELCIRRPVMTVLLSLSLVLAGLLAYQKLPISALPSFNTPTISVSASLPGASPDTMASSVATPLEKQFSTIAGLSVISSTNTQGNTNITLEFNNDRNIDAAAVDVQAALLRAQKSLPAEMTSMPSYRKVNPADAPILLLALSSPSMPLSDLNSYADNWISPSLSTLDGVAQVQIYGQKRYAVRIRLDPARLASRNLTLDEVATALKNANSNSPVGMLESKSQTLTIQANKQLKNAAEVGQLILSSKNGAPIRLKDIATVEDSVENLRAGSWVNGERSIVLAVLRQPDANTVKVVDAIIRTLPHLRDQLPGSISLKPLNDRSQSIRDAIHDVEFTLMLTIALVIMVIFIFLQRATATLIPTLSLPISLIGTFGMMQVLGYSLDNISLLGITLAVGLVVDDAIVMLENIVRHIENGLKPLEAALRGAREIAFTIVSISVSLVAVFIPIFFMDGVVGLLFHEFAVVVTLAILISALVSLTLIPLLGSRWLSADDAHAPSQRGLAGFFERQFQKVLGQYEKGLDWALAHRKTLLGVALASLAGSIVLFQVLPKGFFPEEDNGQISGSVEARQDIAYPAMLALQQQVAAKLGQNPYVDTVTSAIGGGASNGSTNTGRLFINLKPRKARPAMPQVMESLRKDLRQIAGVNVYLSPLQNLKLGGKSSKSRYQFTMQSVQGDTLNAWAEKLQRALRDDPLFRDVNSDAQMKGLQAELRIQRDKANLLGVQIADIRTTLYSAFGERQVASLYAANDTYPVILEVAPGFKQTEFDLERLHVRSKSGVLVPVSAFASVARTVGPTAVNHQGQLQAVTLSFNLAPGAALGDAAQRIEQVKQKLGIPANILTGFSGDAAVFQESQSSQLTLILVAIAVIYVLLGVLYESYIHPLTILSGLPSAAMGALGAIWLANLELTVMAMIGILLLIGIVKKNAIMMIDFAIAARRDEGKTAFEAIREACLLRFRPIMMTTLAAMMGALPIALGLGAGAEFRQPLGIAVVGGLVFSQLITLFITPVLYLWLDPFNRGENR